MFKLDIGRGDTANERVLTHVLRLCYACGSWFEAIDAVTNTDHHKRQAICGVGQCSVAYPFEIAAVATLQLARQQL